MNNFAKGRHKKIIIGVSVIIIILIASLILYPVLTPYTSINLLKDKNGINDSNIVSVTVANLGINGIQSTDANILSQWSSFLKKAKYKPYKIFIFGKKPNWVKISMANGQVYYFERWPYFRMGNYLYQFDDIETAQKLFDSVINTK